jgi:microcystin-dependent protein
MNKEDMIKIGIAAFVVIILIVVVVIVTRKKKDNYEYPTGKVYIQPVTEPGAIKRGNGGVSLPPSTFAALVADQNGNINTTASVPIGAIIMWGGSVTSIPAGWGLCNGQVYGNIPSPDLTSRFVVGAGQSITPNPFTTQYGVGDMGGEEFHQLTIEEIPSHSHNITSTNGGTNTKNPMGPDAGSWQGATLLATTSTGGDPDNTKEDADKKAIPLTLPHNNMPPYYALSYIIKYL